MELKQIVELAKSEGLSVERNGATYTISNSKGQQITLKQVKGFLKEREQNNSGSYGFCYISESKVKEQIELLKIQD